VKGIVGDELRALIEVSICSEPSGEKSSVMAWVDTAFNGGLVFPREKIDTLGLKEYSSTPAIAANEGAHPLLGTMLLDGHDLSVSYKRKIVELD